MLVFVSCSDVVVWRRCEDDAVNAAAGGQYMATAAKTKVSDFFMYLLYGSLWHTGEQLEDTGSHCAFQGVEMRNEHLKAHFYVLLLL